MEDKYIGYCYRGRRPVCQTEPDHQDIAAEGICLAMEAPIGVQKDLLNHGESAWKGLYFTLERVER